MQKSKHRLELDKDRDFILQLFGWRCVRCGRNTKTIHEIVPISHGKMSLFWKNRVPVCTMCHDWAHSIGTKNSIPVLQQMRKKFLITKFGLEDDGSLQEKENVEKDAFDLQVLVEGNGEAKLSEDTKEEI